VSCLTAYGWHRHWRTPVTLGQGVCLMRVKYYCRIVAPRCLPILYTGVKQRIMSTSYVNVTSMWPASGLPDENRTDQLCWMYLRTSLTERLSRLGQGENVANTSRGASSFHFSDFTWRNTIIKLFSRLPSRACPMLSCHNVFPSRTLSTTARSTLIRIPALQERVARDFQLQLRMLEAFCFSVVEITKNRIDSWVWLYGR